MLLKDSYIVFILFYRTSWLYSFHEDSDIPLPDMPSPISDPDAVQELPKPMNVSSENGETEGWEQLS